MTNYEKIKLSAFDYIKLCLEMGTLKGVEVGYKIMDEDRDIIVDTKNIITELRALEYWKDKIENDIYITSITPIPNPPNLLPVGTKVRVFDWWIDMYTKEYPDMIGIYSSKDTYIILDTAKHFGYYNLKVPRKEPVTVPSRAVVPVWDS